MPKPECPACATDPHTEPEMPHIHLTDYGYLLYTPDHRMRDYIEEIREYERSNIIDRLGLLAEWMRTSGCGLSGDQIIALVQDPRGAQAIVAAQRWSGHRIGHDCEKCREGAIRG